MWEVRVLLFSAFVHCVRSFSARLEKPCVVKTTFGTDSSLQSNV